MSTMWQARIVPTAVAFAGAIGLATLWVAYSKPVNKPSAVTGNHGDDAGGVLGGQESGDLQTDDAMEPVVGQGESPVEMSKELIDRLKDRDRYYSFPTMQELIDRANDGDEWAIREIVWPKGHRFHEQGRPFFKNNGPHPDGLFPEAGY